MEHVNKSVLIPYDKYEKLLKRYTPQTGRGHDEDDVKPTLVSDSEGVTSVAKNVTSTAATSAATDIPTIHRKQFISKTDLKLKRDAMETSVARPPLKRDAMETSAARPPGIPVRSERKKTKHVVKPFSWMTY